MEVWKRYDDKYGASSTGRIRIAKSGRIISQSKRPNGYLSASIHDKTTSVHKIIAVAFLGHKPNGHKEVVDHIDKDVSNNSIENLRIITQRQNCSNRPNKTSKYTGVSFNKNKGKYEAYIYINKKSKYLGTFKDEYDAHLAYQSELSNLQS